MTKVLLKSNTFNQSKYHRDKQSQEGQAKHVIHSKQNKRKKTEAHVKNKIDQNTRKMDTRWILCNVSEYSQSLNCT